VCSGKKKLTIEEMKIIAAEKEGECLSEKYVNSHFKLTWKCDKGHVWQSKPYVVKQGSWCPFCKNNNRKREKNGKFKDS